MTINGAVKKITEEFKFNFFFLSFFFFFFNGKLEVKSEPL
jgi:hypothetical protein